MCHAPAAASRRPPRASKEWSKELYHGSMSRYKIYSANLANAEPCSRSDPYLSLSNRRGRIKRTKALARETNLKWHYMYLPVALNRLLAKSKELTLRVSYFMRYAINTRALAHDHKRIIAPPSDC